MTGIWALASVALADIENNGAFYPDLASAVAAASSGDTLVFDGGVYEASDVDLGGRSLVFQGNGSTLTDVGSVAAMILLSGGSALQATDLTLESITDRAIDGDDSSLTLGHVTIRTTVGNGNGGGVRLLNPIAITLTDVVFDGTTALGSGSSGQGGGLWVSGAMSQVVLDGGGVRRLLRRHQGRRNVRRGHRPALRRLPVPRHVGRGRWRRDLRHRHRRGDPRALRLRGHQRQQRRRTPHRRPHHRDRELVLRHRRHRKRGARSTRPPAGAASTTACSSTPKPPTGAPCACAWEVGPSRTTT
jgi:hypothetical protein